MKILVFPRDGNPYQELLYRPMRQAGTTVAYLEGSSGSHTLNLLTMPFMLIARRFQGFNILHVHWTYPFRLPFGRGPIARGYVELLAYIVWLLAKLLGMKLVWTAHNARPHEPLFLDDVRAHRFLGNVADRVIVHSKAAEMQLREMGITNKNIMIIPHGNYIGVYPDETSRALARKKLRIASDASVFLFYGLIRPYKGVEQLMTAFAGLKDDNAVLVIAGNVQDAGLRQMIERAAKRDARLRLMLRHVPDNESQYLFRAADFTVLPYAKSTTSGVALLAASFACPIVAPDQAAFADMPVGMRIAYPAGKLAKALQKAAEASAARQHDMGDTARRYAESLSWDGIAAETLAFLESGK
jgi:glycosyltransferase involved in cell wall biosynthesis